MQKAIGLVIKEIVNEKRLKATKIALQLGISRQNVYQTYARVTIPDGELNTWANVLGMSRTEILARAESIPTPTERTTIGDESFADLKKLLENQLKEKDEQIKSLQEALKESQKSIAVLLGKFKEYFSKPTRPFYTGSRGKA